MYGALNCGSGPRITMIAPIPSPSNPFYCQSGGGGEPAQLLNASRLNPDRISGYASDPRVIIPNNLREAGQRTDAHRTDHSTDYLPLSEIFNTPPPPLLHVTPFSGRRVVKLNSFHLH